LHTRSFRVSTRQCSTQRQAADTPQRTYHETPERNMPGKTFPSTPLPSPMIFMSEYRTSPSCWAHPDYLDDLSQVMLRQGRKCWMISNRILSDHLFIKEVMRPMPIPAGRSISHQGAKWIWTQGSGYHVQCIGRPLTVRS
jgi:hypothetical protein